MVNLTKRQQLILEDIIKEYIKSARPVSSHLLKKRYHLEIKPATIRRDFQELTKAGLIAQPYTSAGRVPTDRGYRFFVDKILEEKRIFPRKKIIEELSLLKKEFENEIVFWQELTRKIAQLSSNLAFVYLLNEMIFIKEGWARIAKNPEFQDSNSFKELVTMVEKLEEKIKYLLNFNTSQKINVFIGRESKIPHSKGFSMIIAQKELKREKRIIALVGPKRMDYFKNLSIMNSLVKVL